MFDYLVNKVNFKTILFLIKTLIILTIILVSTPFSFADTIKIKDKFLNSIETLLNDNFKNTDFSIKSKEGTKPEIGILTLKPIIDTDDNLLFFQGSFFTHDGDRETLNLGLGNRIFSPDDTFMFGVNGFYDYEIDYAHQRLGVGAEIKSSILELTTNRYLGLSETRTGKNGNKEEVLNGYDIELGAHVPYIPTAKFYTKFFEYEVPDNSDFEGIEYSSKIGIPNFGIDVEVGFTDYANTGSEDEWFFDLTYSFGKKTSDKSFITNEAYEKISTKDNKYDKVRRENLIVKSKESFSIKAAGF
jgi:adhesin/invasin